MTELTVPTQTVSFDGLPLPQRFWAMLTISVAIGMTMLDSQIANVALPSIARSLGAAPALSIWVVNAYQLALVMALLPCSALGDIVGLKKIYQTGFVVFTLASLGCALCPTLLSLSILRFIQGIGAAGITSVNAAMIRSIYPSKLFGRGLGLIAMVIATSAAIAPTFAAAVLSLGPWPWLFLINVPIGGFCLVISMRTLPDVAGTGNRFDTLSAVLSALTFGLLLTAIEGLGHSKTNIGALAMIASAVIIGFFFIRRQLTEEVPLFAIDLLRRPNFALSIITSVCSFLAQMAAYVALPFYLQDVLGYTQVGSGLLLSPWPLGTLIAAPVSGRLSDRYSAGILGGIGLTVLAIGLVLLALLPAHPTAIAVMWRMALCGFGFGFFQPPNNREMFRAVPKERSGGANGMQSTARLTGQTLGAVVVALIFGTFASAPREGNVAVLVVSACFAVGAACVSCMRIGRGQPTPVVEVEVPVFPD